MAPILIVVMPFAAEDGPHLGASLLAASLKQNGFDCDLLYLNLFFAEKIGLEQYRAIDKIPTLLLGERLFAASLFGDDISDIEEYVTSIIGDFSKKTIEELKMLEQKASEFIEAALQDWDWSKYSFIGFTSSFQQNIASLALAKRLREKYTDVKIIFGGANAEDEMGRTLIEKFPFIDAVVSGEAEEALPQLLKNFRYGFIDAGVVMNLNSLPIPDFSDYYDQLIDSKLSLPQRKTHLRFETSRGCWWGEKLHCSFCGLNGSTILYRNKETSRIIEEMKLFSKYPARSILFTDNAVALESEWLHKLNEENLKFRMFIEIKPPVKRIEIKQLSSIGVRRIQPGIESFSTSALIRMKKGTRAVDNIALLKWAMEEGIGVTWNLLCPLDKKDEIEVQAMAGIIPLLFHLQPPLGIFEIQIHRFSPIFQDPIKYGIEKIVPVSAYKFVYPFDDETLKRIAYFFEPAEPIDKPYLSTLIQAVEEWKVRAESGKESCVMADNGKRLLVYDNRMSRDESYSYEGKERELLLLCEEPKSIEEILSSSRFFAGNSDIMQTASDLIKKHLLIFIDDRFLTLPIKLEADEISADGYLFGAASARGSLLQSMIRENK